MYSRVIIFLNIIILLFSLNTGYSKFERNKNSSGKEILNPECKTRCQNLKHPHLSRCLSRCYKSSKTSGENSQTKTKERLETCADICKDYKGSENLKCRRICLERIRIKDRHNPHNIKNYSEACQKRCRNKPKKYQFNCLQRCKKSEEETENSRSNSRSVW